MARSIKPIWIPLSIAFFALGPVAACGGGGLCGNGRLDEGEQCDSDTEACCDCVVCLPPNTTVKWTMNQDPVPGFGSDSCIELGISTVEVELLGPSPQILSGQCGLRQVVFTELAAGLYTARVRPLDSDGVLLVTEPVDYSFQVGVGDLTIEVNIPPDAWIGPYTGSYFFDLTWNGAVCTSAVPVVVEQRVVMEQNGALVPLLDSEGAALTGPCREGVQSAVNVPFGHALLRVQGVDDVGTVHYEDLFETFVGAGPSNTTFAFDLMTDMPDAGVADAGVPDASVPDASVPDAMP